MCPPDILENVGDDPLADAVAVARAKALAVAARQPEAVVIAADTVVFTPARVYGKPRDAAEARSTLRALRGQEHSVVTGLAVARDGTCATAHGLARVTLSPLSDVQIDAYVASGRPLDKAGAYAIQDSDVPTVARIEGCYCCVVGLPLWRLWTLLGAAGVEAEAPRLAACAACPDRPPA